MKMGSLATALALVGCAAWPLACSSDSAPPSGADASTEGDGGGTGGKGAGGTSKGGSGGGGAGKAGASSSNGGAAGNGGRGGAGGAATGGVDAGAPTEMPDASVGPDASDSGAPTPDGGAKPDGAANCADLRCYPYPKVLYPALNPASDDKAMLGKFLFWDEQMGELDSMACGTCHRSFAGGSDPRTNDPGAHLPGPDGVLDPEPTPPTSDDIRGAQGVLACASPSMVTGTSPQVTTRKPPSYFDAMFNPRNFWDGRAGDCNAGDGNLGGCFYDPDSLVLDAHAKPLIAGSLDPVTNRMVGAALEAQSVGPPVNPKEMSCSDQTWAKLEAKLTQVTPLHYAKAGSIPQDMKDFAAQYPTYPKMFAQAFGSTAKLNASDPDDVINSRRIAFAIATHERRLTSDQTPFDRWVAGDDSALTAQQLRGYQAFMGVGRCQFCHPPPLFTDSAFHNIGFHKPSWDSGRSAITLQSSDLGKFKTPTLRNVGLREQYGLLHEGDGPGHDLNSILLLYKQGGQRTDPDIEPFIDPGLLAVPLTAGDIADIIEFLRNGLTDPRVKAETAPFDRPHFNTE
ncbi:MAG TPA: cytochrome c peroxidase [Polyangiaceae bacterium]|nr:cytochrome c peroxidase [Polyangiaceae bacterium]